MNEPKEDWHPHISVVRNNIWYSGNMTLVSVIDLIKELQTCIIQKSLGSTINLFISSGGGGCITSSLMLYTFLNLNYKDINVIGTSKLCSGATYFLFTKCKTFVYPDIYVLFHPMSFDYNDNQGAVKAREKLYRHLIKSVNNIYLTKSFKCNWAKEDIYLFSKDLITKNIIDGIWQQY